MKMNKKAKQVLKEIYKNLIDAGHPKDFPDRDDYAQILMDLVMNYFMTKGTMEEAKTKSCLVMHELRKCIG